jgi:hypothetical protein
MWETANVNSVGQLPNLLLVRNGGNVGIGTGATTPSQKLDVNGNFSLRGNNFIYNTTDGIINWGSGTTGNLYFRTLTTQGVTTSYTDRMTILNNGNVGIGAPAPTAKLEVNGQVKITGGTPGTGKVLTSDATGLASWQPVSGLLSGGTANYLPKWSSANSLSSTSSLYDNGNVGINTTNPREKLEVLGNVRIGGESINYPAVDPNTALAIYQNGTGKKGLKFVTWDNSVPLISIESVNFPNYSPFIVYGSGQTRIGNPNIQTPHTDALLAVSGKVVCQSLYVLKPTSWADYVFKNKNLEKLETVEKYIDENKHLPGMPSEEEIYANGYNINEIDAKLLEKIETLYLHIIALEKEVKELKNK